MSRRHELRRQWASDVAVLQHQGAKPISFDRWAVNRQLGEVETAVGEGDDISVGGLSSVAGEDLSPGNRVRLGEDGKVYRIGSTKGRLAAAPVPTEKNRSKMLPRSTRRRMRQR